MNSLAKSQWNEPPHQGAVPRRRTWAVRAKRTRTRLSSFASGLRFGGTKPAQFGGAKPPRRHSTAPSFRRNNFGRKCRRDQCPHFPSGLAPLGARASLHVGGTKPTHVGETKPTGRSSIAPSLRQNDFGRKCQRDQSPRLTSRNRGKSRGDRTCLSRRCSLAPLLRGEGEEVRVTTLRPSRGEPACIHLAPAARSRPPASTRRRMSPLTPPPLASAARRRLLPPR
jgi:hypothetical protein